MEDLNLVTVYILHPAAGILVWAKRLGVLSTSGILEPFNRLFNLGFILLDGHIIFRVRRTLRGFSQAAVTFALEPPATGEFKATTSPGIFGRFSLAFRNVDIRHSDLIALLDDLGSDEG